MNYTIRMWGPWVAVFVTAVVSVPLSLVVAIVAFGASFYLSQQEMHRFDQREAARLGSETRQNAGERTAELHRTAPGRVAERIESDKGQSAHDALPVHDQTEQRRSVGARRTGTRPRTFWPSGTRPTPSRSSARRTTSAAPLP